MDDSEIVGLYFERSEEAISRTDEKYGALAKKLAYNILGTHADSEECVLDAYLAVWNSVPPERPKSLKAYLLGIVRNISIVRLRHDTAKKRSRDLEISFDELEALLPDRGFSPGSNDGEISEAISEFLRGESRDSRLIFLRKYFYFDSIAEISARFGFSEAKIKSSLKRTRERLRKFLTERGIYI